MRRGQYGTYENYEKELVSKESSRCSFFINIFFAQMRKSEI